MDHFGSSDIKILVLKIKLYAPWVHSLKEKRMIVKSILSKIRNKFQVSASEVENQDVHQTIVIAAAFDRETGEYISNYELFTCPEEEIIKNLLDMVQVTDAGLREEMEAAFKPEYIAFFPDNMEVSFPAGTLPSQEHCYMLGFELDEEVCEILQEIYPAGRTIEISAGSFLKIMSACIR